MALTTGSLPKSFSYALRVFFRIAEFRSGCHPGYSDSCVTSAPANAKTASTLSPAAFLADVTELRWLVPILITPSPVILTEARLDEVSTSPFMSLLMANTP